MLIADGEEAAAAAAGEARLGALLGIELVKLRTGIRHVGDKRDIVGFRHRVRKGDEDFAVAFGDGYFVLGVGLLRRKGRELRSAAANGNFSDGIYNISANGADIENALFHICAAVEIFDGDAGKKLRHGDSESRRKGLQKGNIRETPTRFP